MTSNIWQKTKHPILALAPMAGYTDPAFRVMCLKNKADIVYTEMVSVEAIWRKNKKTLKMLELLPHPSKKGFAFLYPLRRRAKKKSLLFSASVQAAIAVGRNLRPINTLTTIAQIVNGCVFVLNQMIKGRRKKVIDAAKAVLRVIIWVIAIMPRQIRSSRQYP